MISIKIDNKQIENRLYKEFQLTEKIKDFLN